MRLLFLNSPMGTFTPTHSGAIATIIWELCGQAAAQGIDPLILSRDSDKEPYKEFKTIFVDFPPEPKSGPSLFLARGQRKIAGWTHLGQGAYARRIAAAIETNRLQDHAVVMFNDPEMAVFLRSRFPNLFILHWFQNQLVCKNSSRRDFAASVNAIGAVSNFTSRWVEDYYSAPTNSVRTIYNAVNVRSFSPAPQSPPLPPIINFVGRTGIEKAPDLLLNACIRLAGRTKNFSLQIIGSNHWGRFEMDEYQQSLQTLVAQLEALGITVRRPGHIDRPSLPAEIRKAHIHVVPSRWDEPCALAILEGMSSGLAAVASATGGTPELIGPAGLLFERDSIDGLAFRLAELVENEEHRQDVAARCRRRAEEFTWANTWERLKSLLPA